MAVVGVLISHLNKNQNSPSTLFPGDTILAASITTDAVLTFNEVPTNPIHIYPVDCDTISVHTEVIKKIEDIPNVKNGISIIDPYTSGNSYLVLGTKAEISLQIDAKSKSNAYICLFINASDYDTFTYPVEPNDFYKVLDKGRCDILENATHNMTFAVNETGYYFAAVSPRPNHMLGSLQFNLSLVRNFYNHSDFLDHEEPCSLSEATSSCEIKSKYPNTCVMEYTAPMEDSNDFVTTITSTKRPLNRNTAFIASMAVLSVLCLASVITVASVCYNYKK